MSKHSIRNGASGRCERLLQRGERTGAGVVVGRPLELVLRERLLRVVGDRREQLALRAPLRDPHAHLRAAHDAEELLVRARRLRARPARAPRAACRRRSRRRRAARGACRTSSGVSTSSTLSTTRPLRPTTRPRRTKNTCTDASSGSSASPMTSKSSSFGGDHLLALDRPCGPRATGPAAGPPARTRALPTPRASASRAGRASARVSPSRNERRSVDERGVLLVVDVADARRRALLDVRVEARPPEAVVAVELGLACTCGSGRSATAGRASRGSRTRARTDRSTGRPCASRRAAPSPAATPRRA